MADELIAMDLDDLVLERMAVELLREIPIVNCTVSGNVITDGYDGTFGTTITASSAGTASPVFSAGTGEGLNFERGDS